MKVSAAAELWQCGTHTYTHTWETELIHFWKTSFQHGIAPFYVKRTTHKVFGLIDRTFTMGLLCWVCHKTCLIPITFLAWKSMEVSCRFIVKLPLEIDTQRTNLSQVFKIERKWLLWNVRIRFEFVSRAWTHYFIFYSYPSHPKVLNEMKVLCWILLEKPNPNQIKLGSSWEIITWVYLLQVKSSIDIDPGKSN